MKDHKTSDDKQQSIDKKFYYAVDFLSLVEPWDLWSNLPERKNFTEHFLKIKLDEFENSIGSIKDLQSLQRIRKLKEHELKSLKDLQDLEKKWNGYRIPSNGKNDIFESVKKIIDPICEEFQKIRSTDFYFRVTRTEFFDKIVEQMSMEFSSHLKADAATTEKCIREYCEKISYSSELKVNNSEIKENDELHKLLVKYFILKKDEGNNYSFTHEQLNAYFSAKKGIKVISSPAVQDALAHIDLADLGVDLDAHGLGENPKPKNYSATSTNTFFPPSSTPTSDPNSNNTGHQLDEKNKPK